MESVRPTSKWGRERKGWYRGAARTRIFEHVMLPLYLLGILAISGAVVAARELPARAGWVALGGALLALGFGVALVRARSWAWRACGVLAALWAVGHVVSLFAGKVTSAGMALLWALVAVELLRASPRALAEQARTGEPPRELAHGGE